MVNSEKYRVSVESRMCHPETCCCKSHGIYVIRTKEGLFVERFEREEDALGIIKILLDSEK